MIVYFHRNPKTFKIFYVGIGSQIKRAKDRSPTGRSIHWHRYVKKHGLPLIQIVHSEISKEDAIKWEIFYIKLFGKINDGGELVNMTDGGELAENLAEYVKMYPERNPMKNPIHVAKLSGENNSSKRPEVREKLRIANLGKKASAETRLKQSLLKKGKPSTQPKGYKHSPEVIARLRIINKEIASRPEVIERMKTQNLGRRCFSKHVKVDKMDVNGNFIQRYDCIMDALKEFGKPKSGNITSVCVGRRNFAFGFKWQYVA